MTVAPGMAVIRRRGQRAGLVVLGLAALTLAANAWWISNHLDWLRPLEAGQPAPAFELPAIGDDGRLTADQVRLQDLRGKVVVIEFWATWCGPCRASLPKLATAAAGWGDQAVVLAVNLDDAVRARELFRAPVLARSPIRLVADAGDAALRYQVDMLPHVVVIDRAGVVRLVGRGGVAVGDAERAAARLIEAVP